MTVLFCDLVGFTARSDRADPEDVKAMLKPFHTRLKREIEAFGGTLDKFIGDAALGVFGSPAAHEDDPERAIRAAMAIVEGIDSLNQEHPELGGLAVRVGIETGEAVVSQGAGPQIGEAVTGDVVNTASRLQGVAPVGGIVVGESTYRATREVFVFEALEPVTVKGKARALGIWRPLEARARLGQDVTRTHTAPFVGREGERRVLLETFDRSWRDRTVQLVTVTGEPGVGKSRLVAELGRHVDGLPDLVAWRQGRCLPYGEGVTFWALGEIVKAHAGIMDSDTPEQAATKVEAVIPESEQDREWLRRRLAPLIGLDRPTERAEREESFAAWRRFMESIASVQPAIFVFEDIHWADPALLDFLQHVAATSTGVPITLVCTARPELLERHPGWAQGLTNSTILGLSPLSTEETSRLVSGLLDHAVLPAEVQSLILERAGGNPLYAEEFVRMLGDRGLLARQGRTLVLAPGQEIPYPESIQALIAARLDTVSSEVKGLLQDASVVGKVFWSGAVVAMGGRGDAAVSEALESLAHKELIREGGQSSIEGEAEYEFWHALVRDVAYGQIPRGARADKHRAVAQWIEGVAGARMEDHAEILSHHYTQAMELARASGSHELAAELEAPALRFLVAAGDRALGLDVIQAQQHYERALDLAPRGHPHRPDVLARWADAARQAGRFREAAEASREAVEGFREGGDAGSAARSLRTLSNVFLSLGDPRQEDAALEAVALLEAGPAGPDLVGAYAQMAGVKLVLGDNRGVIAWVDRAIALATELGVEVPPRALGFRGYARASLGEVDGLDDMRGALQSALRRGEGRDAAVIYNNLSVVAMPIEGPGSSMDVLTEGIDFSERRGIAEMANAMRAGSLDVLGELGRWDEALELAASIAARAEAEDDVADLIQARWVQARLLPQRGEATAALEIADWLVGKARELGSPEEITPSLSSAAQVYTAVGRVRRARELLTEIDRTPNARENSAYPPRLPEMVRTAVGGGDLDLAARLAEGVELDHPWREHAVRASRAILAEAWGRFDEATALYAEAVGRWESFGVVPERAHALLGQARSLLELGRVVEATGLLGEAGEIFSSLGAKPLLEEVDGLIGRAAMSS